MESDTADKILSQAALDGSMDYAVWPELLPVVLARIEKIAHTEFRIPNLPTPPPAAPPRPSSPRFIAPLPSSDPVDAPDGTGTPSSQGTDKENADPTAQPPRRASAAPAADVPSQQPSGTTATSTLPKPIADMLDEVLSVLRTNFPRYPPHTIQRLSELVLKPRQHYRNLVPWLHALDRVVHVTSGANTYPLPPALPDIGAMSLLVNGAGGAGPTGGMTIDTDAANNNNNSNNNDPGSDEALGGALLTPIPWLARTVSGDGSDGDDGEGSDVGSSNSSPALPAPQQQFQLQLQQRHLEARVQTESTETIEGPNGMGSIETVSISVNGIPSTGASVASFLVQRSSLVQPPPLRQQQQQQQQQRQADGEEDATMKDGPGSGSKSDAHDDGEGEEEEEIPHARGPAEIGPADTGPLEPAVAELIRSSASSIASSGRRSASPGAIGAERVPPSPKREAEDDLEPETPTKRRRDGDDEVEDADEKGGEKRDEEKEEEKGGNAEADTTASKKDAEGDVVLPDAGESEDRKTSATSASAAAEKGTTAGESQGG
ncbi:hypothetical protein VTJ49DRAFT_1057 [Mycothermus thermophilus]|uniref:Uncharacterized protein n=1 Tax=Humicola insolens TaxID=85995 RepID=A0ABR3VDN4_HUMIN